MRHVDSFEIIPDRRLTRSVQRRAALGLAADPARVDVAPAVRGAADHARLRRGRAGQPDRDHRCSSRPRRLPAQRPTLFSSSPTCCCRSAGWSCSGATAPTTGATWALGTDEFKRVVRAVVDGRGQRLVPRLRHQDRRCPGSRSAIVSARRAAATSCSCRYLARPVLHLVRAPAGHAAHRMLLVGTLPEALEVYTAVTRNPAAGLVPVAIHLTDGYAAARGIADPGAGVRRPRRARRWSARWAPTRSRSAARPAPSPASCAGWPGSWRAPASTWSSRRSSPTSPARGCTSARSRACRCCTSRSRRCPASRWLAKNLLDRVAAGARPARC